MGAAEDTTPASCYSNLTASKHASCTRSSMWTLRFIYYSLLLRKRKTSPERRNHDNEFLVCDDDGDKWNMRDNTCRSTIKPFVEKWSPSSDCPPAPARWPALSHNQPQNALDPTGPTQVRRIHSARAHKMPMKVLEFKSSLSAIHTHVYLSTLLF